MEVRIARLIRDHVQRIHAKITSAAIMREQTIFANVNPAFLVKTVTLMGAHVQLGTHVATEVSVHMEKGQNILAHVNLDSKVRIVKSMTVHVQWLLRKKRFYAKTKGNATILALILIVCAVLDLRDGHVRKTFKAVQRSPVRTKHVVTMMVKITSAFVYLVLEEGIVRKISGHVRLVILVLMMESAIIKAQVLSASANQVSMGATASMIRDLAVSVIHVKMMVHACIMELGTPVNAFQDFLGEIARKTIDHAR